MTGLEHRQQTLWKQFCYNRHETGTHIIYKVWTVYDIHAIILAVNAEKSLHGWGKTGGSRNVDLQKGTENFMDGASKQQDRLKENRQQKEYFSSESGKTAGNL